MGESAERLRELGCGQVVGKYRILRRIATGGMAEVYVARRNDEDGAGVSAGTNRPSPTERFAIKKVLPQFSTSERFIDMLVDEAKITVSLTHPNIAEVFELGVHGTDYFLVMEYVDGRPLNRIIQRVLELGRRSVPITHAVHIISEIAKGLHHAHQQRDPSGHPLGIVHRDVSPQNVLTTYEGKVKLIDFGIARAAGRINQTSTGIIKGKLRYLAPEIATGEEVDGRADVFCCGIVLFEMLTGEPMFSPKSDFEAIEMASTAAVRSPRSRNGKISPELDSIVMKMLQRKPSDRYQTAHDLHVELQRFLERVAPNYSSATLGGFLGELFEAEKAEDRATDALAERLAHAAEIGFDSEDPTMAEGHHEPPPFTGVYRSVVTRLEIARDFQLLLDADGGAPMAVVPAVPKSLFPESSPPEASSSSSSGKPIVTPRPLGAAAPSIHAFTNPPRLAVVEPAVSLSSSGVVSVVPVVPVEGTQPPRLASPGRPTESPNFTATPRWSTEVRPSGRSAPFALGAVPQGRAGQDQREPSSIVVPSGRRLERSSVPFSVEPATSATTPAHNPDLDALAEACVRPPRRLSRFAWAWLSALVLVVGGLVFALSSRSERAGPIGPGEPGDPDLHALQPRAGSSTAAVSRDSASEHDASSGTPIDVAPGAGGAGAAHAAGAMSGDSTPRGDAVVAVDGGGNAAEGEAHAADGEAHAAGGEAHAAGGEANAADGEANAADGEAHAAGGEANAADGEANAAGGEANAADGVEAAGPKGEDAETGRIVLKNVAGGRVRASVGRVEADGKRATIHDVPFDVPVKIRVEFKDSGRAPYRTSIKVSATDRVSEAVVPGPGHVPGPARGALRIRAPRPMTIFVDGRKQGRTPLLLRLPPGRHRVVARSGRTVTRRWVRVVAGETAVLKLR